MLMRIGAQIAINNNEQVAYTANGLHLHGSVPAALRRNDGHTAYRYQRTLTAAQYSQGHALRIHVKTLRRLAREGRVPCAKIGKYYRFRLSELDHWVRQNHNGISRPFRVKSGDDLEIHA
jgi:excisionase family DNA binding protein